MVIYLIQFNGFKHHLIADSSQISPSHTLRGSLTKSLRNPISIRLTHPRVRCRSSSSPTPKKPAGLPLTGNSQLLVDLAKDCKVIRGSSQPSLHVCSPSEHPTDCLQRVPRNEPLLPIATANPNPTGSCHHDLSPGLKQLCSFYSAPFSMVCSQHSSQRTPVKAETRSWRCGVAGQATT